MRNDYSPWLGALEKRTSRDRKITNTIYEMLPQYAKERPFAQEEELIQAIAQDKNEGKGRELLPQLLSSSFYTSGSFRNRQDYLIGFSHLFCREIIKKGFPGSAVGLICNYIIYHVERVSTDKELEQLWYEMLHAYSEIMRGNRDVSPYTRPVQKCLTYIGEHPAEKISLSSMAEVLGYHPYYLSALFQKEVGQTIAEYSAMIRLEQALFFLESTDYSIQAISTATGFPDQSNFARAFKKWQGVTPTQYRNGHRKKSSEQDIPI